MFPASALPSQSTFQRPTMLSMLIFVLCLPVIVPSYGSSRSSETLLLNRLHQQRQQQQQRYQHRRSLNVNPSEEDLTVALTRWPHLKHQMEGFVGERKFILECPIVVQADALRKYHQKYRKMPAISWYHNTVHIPIPQQTSATTSSARIRQLPAGDLVINKLRLGDAGTYTCRSTLNASLTHSIRVDVVDPNIHAHQFELERQSEEESQFLSDQPAVAAALTAQPPRPSAPQFVSVREMYEHQLHVVRSSGTVQFNCAAIGWPQPTTEWFHNGQRVNVQLQQQYSRALLTDNHSTGGRGQTLTFNNIDARDAGNFTCRVRNEFGVIEFAYRVRVISSSVSTNALPIIDSGGMMNQTELVNTSAKFECRVRSTQPNSNSAPRILWYKNYAVNGQFVDNKTFDPFLHPLGNTSRITLTLPNRKVDEINSVLYYTSVLQIRNVTSNDTAFYICIVPTNNDSEQRMGYLNVVENINDLPPGHPLLYDAKHRFYPTSTYSTFYQWLILFIVVGICVAISILFIAIVYWRFRLWRESPLKCAPQQTVLFRKRIVIDRIGNGGGEELLPRDDATSFNTQLTSTSSPTMTTLLGGGGGSIANTNGSHRISGTLSASASMHNSSLHPQHQPRMFFPRVRIEKVSFRSSMPSTELTSLSEYEMPVNPEWEFPRECIRLHEEVGQGAFGRVVRAEAFRIRRAKTTTLANTAAPATTSAANNKSSAAQSTTSQPERDSDQNTYFNDPVVSINRWRRKSRTPSHNMTSTTSGLRLLNDEDYFATYQSTATATAAADSTATTPKSPCSSSSNNSSATSAAVINSDWTTVAVKMLKDDGGDREMKALVTELELMMDFGSHPNIVNLLGCCTQGGPLFVVVEYAPFGNLRNFLYKHRTYLDYERAIGMRTLEPSDLVRYAWQIACGMEYIASRKWVHRDLAARNILVGEGEVMKIADFGLSRDVHDTKDVYVRGKYSDTKMPIKWMAPEVLFDGVYTSQSDVWSFAVVLWEIFSYGGQPYPSLAQNDLYEFLKSGKRMNAPEGCPEDVAQIMQQCWMVEPTQRPNFTQLVERLETLQLRLNTNEQQARAVNGQLQSTKAIQPVSSQLHRQIMHNQNLSYSNSSSGGNTGGVTPRDNSAQTSQAILGTSSGFDNPVPASSTADGSYTMTTVVESAYLLP